MHQRKMENVINNKFTIAQDRNAYDVDDAEINFGKVLIANGDAAN
jgi:hypothetical protein